MKLLVYGSARSFAVSWRYIMGQIIVRGTLTPQRNNNNKFYFPVASIPIGRFDPDRRQV
jgi:hypothetical protein